MSNRRARKRPRRFWTSTAKPSAAEFLDRDNTAQLRRVDYDVRCYVVGRLLNRLRCGVTQCWLLSDPAVLSHFVSPKEFLSAAKWLERAWQSVAIKNLCRRKFLEMDATFESDGHQDALVEANCHLAAILQSGDLSRYEIEREVAFVRLTETPVNIVDELGAALWRIAGVPGRRLELLCALAEFIDSLAYPRAIWHQETRLTDHLPSPILQEDLLSSPLGDCNSGSIRLSESSRVMSTEWHLLKQPIADPHQAIDRSWLEALSERWLNVGFRADSLEWIMGSLMGDCAQRLVACADRLHAAALEQISEPAWRSSNW
jgi:hypothetical protein